MTSKKTKLDCLTCLQKGTQCENLVGLYKLEKRIRELRVIVASRVLRCPLNGLSYELTPLTPIVLGKPGNDADKGTES